MLNREELVEQARTLLRRLNVGMCHDSHDKPCGHCAATADALVDTLLPQVSTVEELKALPNEAVAIASEAGAVWSHEHGEWWGAGCPDPDSPEDLARIAADYGPLTVV